jgi:hypothetical protein
VDKLASKLNDIKRDFEVKLRQLADTQQTVAQHAQALMAFAPTLVGAREDALLSLYDSFGQMQAKYEQAVADEMTALRIRRQKVEARLTTLRILDEDAQRASADCPLSAIAHIDEFYEHVMHATRIATDAVETPNPQIENDLVPPFSSQTIKFKTFREADNQEFISPPIELDGNEWRVKLYPFGNGGRRTLSAAVFVELLSGVDQRSQVTYRVEIEAVSLIQANIVNEFVAKPTVGQSWGWKKFCSTGDLHSDDYLDEAGTLTLTLSVRADSYHTLWQWIRAGNERKLEKLKAARAKAHARAPPKTKPPS